MYIRSILRGQKNVLDPWELEYKQFDSHVGAGTQTIGERAFVLSHLSSPIFSSLYHQFDALLGGSQLVMTTRKIKLKAFTHYLVSQAVKPTSQQEHLLGGDY